MKPQAWIWGLAASVIVLLGGCAGATASGPSAPPPSTTISDPKTNAEHVTMLSQLVGYKLDTSAPKDPQGQALSDKANPLGNAPSAVLNKESELFLAGLDGDDAPHGFDISYYAAAVLDGKTKTEFSSVWTSQVNELDWTSLAKKSFGADVNADGLDEIAVLYWGDRYQSTGETSWNRDLKLALYQGKPSKASLLASVLLGKFTETEVNAFYSNYSEAVLNASFDLDAGRYTGTDEYQLAASALGKVYLIGGASAGYKVLTSRALPAASAAGLQILNLTSGDTDGDGTDEVLALNGLLTGKSTGNGGSATLFVLDAKLGDKVAPKIVSDGTVTMASGSLDAGDSDGDGLDEVTCSGNTNQGRAYTFVLDDLKANFAVVASADLGSAMSFSTGAAMSDVDGDGLKEVLGFTKLFDDLRQATGSSLKVLKNDILEATTSNNRGMWQTDCVAVGQFGATTATVMDKCEDIALVNGNGYDVLILSWNAVGGAMKTHGINTYDKGRTYPTLAAANIDNDSTYVEFEARELLYTDPHVVALLSCYPFWDGLDMSGGGNAGSAYTTGTTNTQGSSQTVGVSASLKIGYSGGVDNVWEASITAEFSSSLDYSWGKEVSRSVSKTFDSGKEDSVVFTTIPYDVYYYRVISSANPGLKANDRITASVPRAPIISVANVGFYNLHNGKGQDITNEANNLIGHTIGNPKSYPGPAFVRDRINDGSMVIYNNDSVITPGFSEGSMTVGIGEDTGKATSIELSYSETKSSVIASDFAVTVEAEYTQGGVVSGGSVGFHYGEEYSVSQGKDTAFSGAIGKLSPANADKAFPWSLFVYKKKLPNTTTDQVLVLQYCYEGQ